MNSASFGFMRIYASDGSAGSPRSAQPAAAGALEIDRFLLGGVAVDPLLAGDRTASVGCPRGQGAIGSKRPPFLPYGDYMSNNDLLSRGD